MSRRRAAVRDNGVEAPLGSLLDALDITHIKVQGWQSITCSFHDEDVPSLRVNIESGGFQCQACGAHGGDVYEFIKLRDNVSFPEAKRIVHSLIGVQSEDTSFRPAPPVKRREGRRGYVPRYKRKVD